MLFTEYAKIYNDVCLNCTPTVNPDKVLGRRNQIRKQFPELRVFICGDPKMFAKQEDIVTKLDKTKYIFVEYHI